MFEIIPGILEKDWEKIEEKIEIVKPFAKTIHIDLLDGKFADNTTFLDPEPFKKYSEEIFFELHMMVENPLSYVEKWAEAGFRRFIGHVEKMPDQIEFVATAQRFGEVGLAIDGPTPLEKITVPLRDLDTILCMTIKAGFSGQSFDEKNLEKVKIATESLLPIEVDGGVNDKTIVQAAHAGARRFITTSFLFGSDNPQSAFEKLHHCMGS